MLTEHRHSVAPNVYATAAIAVLRPLLHGWPRAVVLGLMAFLTVWLVLAYAQIRDNNNVLGMLPSGSDADPAYAYYLDEYVRGFGDDDALFIAFETSDALSNDSVKLLANVQAAIKDLHIPLQLSSASSVNGGSTAVAVWPWRRAGDPALLDSPPSLPECLRERSDFSLTYDECLRRILSPVKIELQRQGDECFIVPSAIHRGNPQKPIPIDCDASSGPRLRFVLSTLSYRDFLPFLPGAGMDTQMNALRAYMQEYGHQTAEFMGRALPPLQGALIAGEQPPYKAVAVLARLTDFHDRDDLRSVAVSWVRDRLRATLPGIEFHLLGGPVVLGRNTHEVAVTHLAREPLIAVVLFAFLGYLYRRRPRLLLIPIATALMSLVTTMGLYQLFGGTYNWVMAILPIILAVTSVSDSIHLIGFYVEKSTTCVTREAAFERTIHALLTPCFYTSFTTAIGLFSLYCFAPPGPFQDFGLYGTIGIILAFIYSFLLFAMLAPPVETLRGSLPGGTLIVSASNDPPYSRWLIRWCELVVIVSVLMTLIGLFWAVTRSHYEMDTREWYTEDVDITRDVQFVERRMHGSNSFSIQVQPGTAEVDAGRAEVPASNDWGPESVYLTVNQVSALWKIRDKLREQRGEQPGEWAAVLIPDENRTWARLSPTILDYTFAHRDDSPSEIMARLQCYLDGGKLSLLPLGKCEGLDSDDLEQGNRRRVAIEQAHALFNLDDPRPDVRGHRTRAVVLARQGNNADFRDFIALIQADLHNEICESHEKCRAEATGFMPLCSRFFSDILADMINSFALAIALVCGTMFALLWRRPWLALLSLLPNILPFVLVTAFMALLSIPIYYATMMLAAVAMGLVVDDTIQFTHALNRELSAGRELQSGEKFDRSAAFRQAISRALDTAGRAMVNTSLSLMAGFAMLTIGEFRPTDHLGTVIVLIILIALLCDVFMFPALLLWLGKSERFLRRVYPEGR